MSIKSKLQSLEISRYYLSGYSDALASKKLDAKLFADMAEQRRFFSAKLADAKKAHINGIHSAIGMLAAEAKKERGEKEKAAINLQLSALALEVASL